MDLDLNQEKFDINEEWPWKSNTFSYITSIDQFHHAISKVHVMNEAYRILKKGGKVKIEVPSSDPVEHPIEKGAFINAGVEDPLSRSFWNRRSFLYFSEAYPQFRERYEGIKCSFKILVADTKPDPNGVVTTVAECEKVVYNNLGEG